MNSRTLKQLLRVTVFAVAAFVMMPVQDASAQLKVAYVDLQRALNEVSDGKKAKASLKKEFDKKQKQLDSKQTALKRKKAELEAKATPGVPLSPAAQESIRQELMQFQKEMYELQQLYMKLQGELAEAEAKKTKKIFDKMGKIIETIGKSGSYDMILERSESSILYAKDGLDLTNELIKRYDGK